MFRFRTNIFFKRQQSEIQPEEIFMDALNAPGFKPELAEGRIEHPIRTAALLAFSVLLAGGFIVAAGRLAFLQIVRGEELLVRAQANKTYPIVVAPPRGIIYDRGFEKLVENTPAFVITLTPAVFSSDEAFYSGLERVGRLFERTVKEIAESSAIDPAAALDRRGAWPEEVFVAGGEIRDQVIEIQARPEDFPGVVVAEASRRRYLLGTAASHLLGYVGRPSSQDLFASRGARPSDTIGKTGLELVYEEFLRGQAGQKLIEVNAVGEALRERFIDRPVPGRDIVLEIDAGLERFATEALRRHLKALGKRAGAIVAIDPRDGAVRALVSYPAYDSNLLGGGASRQEVARLLTDPADPFFNRAVSGGYPSASTIKPFLAVAALEEGIIDPRREIYDPGYISVPNPYDPSNPTIFKDWKALGMVDLRRAIAFSANVYFYTVGGGYGDIKGLGIDRIGKWLQHFGWGQPLGIDISGEYGGLIPSPEKKKTIRPHDPVWRIGDTYITAIGQGDLQITPLQLAASTAAIANGGTLWRPRLARAVVDSDRNVVQEFLPAVLARVPAQPESWAVVREGMRQAVTAGSAASLSDLFFAVAGKTGTAQTGAYGKNHGWFTGFAPYGEPEIVITVLVEEGTGGSTDAVPIAKEVLYYYFTQGR